MNRKEERFVAALDVGTTTVRCHVLDQNTDTRASATRQVELLYPQPGHVEIKPEQIWRAVVDVVNDAITGAGITASQVTCLGMSTQRCTFITWNRQTGEPFHNLITWQDLRADKYVRSWNASFTVWALRTGASFLHFFTRMKRLLAGSVLTFMNQQVTMRLLWVLDNIPGLRDAVRRGDVMFGTLDTYLLYRLSGGKTHVTDASSASATGMFDPFTMTWASWAGSIFNIPFSILPPVGDSAAPSVTVATADVWGAEIKVSCSVADQGAALFGSCCFTPGDIKVTMGTGAFLNVNTGKKPHASTSGLYPVVGWRIGTDTTYVAEGASNDAGTLVNWAVSNGLLENPQESAKIASLAPDSDEIFFMPAFNGLQAPINDGRAAAGFLGIRASSRRENLVRAILESIAFRVAQLVRVMHQESDVPQRNIRVDGGVSLNDFVIQLIADLTGHPVERPSSTEMSVLGAGFMAGIAAGVWSGKEELKSLRHIERVFQPNIQRHKLYMSKMAKWERALQRFLCWYDDEQVVQVAQSSLQQVHSEQGKPASSVMQRRAWTEHMP